MLQSFLEALTADFILMQNIPYQFQYCDGDGGVGGRKAYRDQQHNKLNYIE